MSRPVNEPRLLCIRTPHTTIASARLSGVCVNTISTASDKLAVPLHRPSVPWFSLLRAARGYDVAVRAIGSAWFLLLALFLARKTLIHAGGMSITDFGPTGWPELLASVCLFLF